jgi:signal transduction histidine kinase
MPEPGAWRAYAVAAAVSAAALALTMATEGLFGGAYLYFPLVAVLVSALHGGLGPGLVTVVGCALGFNFLYLGPRMGFGFSGAGEVHRLAGFVLFGGAVTWIAARFRTSRRQAEAARHEAEAARAEANRIGAQQERLVAVVSHDLRSPLTALGGNLALLTRLGSLTPRQETVVANMRRTCERMEAMIRALLDLARSRAGEFVALAPEPVRAGEICARVLSELRDAHPGAHLSLAMDGDDRARLDPGRIAQAVANLVSNAIQHGAPGAPVAVRVSARPPLLAIEVENEGEPIPAELAPVLFEPFRRGPSRGNGVGLGLFVVRAIARAHGGEASFRSDPGRTVFVLEVPRGEPGAGAPASPAR